jgi:hypothetical protein
MTTARSVDPPAARMLARRPPEAIGHPTATRERQLPQTPDVAARLVAGVRHLPQVGASLRHSLHHSLHHNGVGCQIARVSRPGAASLLLRRLRPEAGVSQRHVAAIGISAPTHSRGGTRHRHAGGISQRRPAIRAGAMRPRVRPHLANKIGARQQEPTAARKTTAAVARPRTSGRMWCASKPRRASRNSS